MTGALLVPRSPFHLRMTVNKVLEEWLKTVRRHQRYHEVAHWNSRSPFPWFKTTREHPISAFIRPRCTHAFSSHSPSARSFPFRRSVVWFSFTGTQCSSETVGSLCLGNYDFFTLLRDDSKNRFRLHEISLKVVTNTLPGQHQNS